MYWFLHAACITAHWDHSVNGMALLFNSALQKYVLVDTALQMLSQIRFCGKHEPYCPNMSQAKSVFSSRPQENTMACTAVKAAKASSNAPSVKISPTRVETTKSA